VTGLTRYEFLCADDFDEDYTFACTTPPPAGSQWYTVCAKPHGNFAAWMGSVGLLGLIGISVLTTLCGVVRRAVV